MKEQEHTMKIQQFESSFYAFLNVYIAIKNELNNNDEEKDFFKTIFLKLNGSVDVELINESPLNCHKIIEKNMWIYSCIIKEDCLITSKQYIDY